MNKNEFDALLEQGGAHRALLFGGKGFEHSVSRLGAANFLSAAERIQRNVIPVYIDGAGGFNIYLGDIAKIADTERELSCDELIPAFPVRLSGESGLYVRGRVLKIELAVPLLHGDFGEDGTVQGLLECAGIPYAGADTLSGALCADKAYSKAAAVSAGVKTLPWLTFCRAEFDTEQAIEEIKRKIGFPAFIKPCRLGSSVGASGAGSESSLAAALDAALSVADRIIAEPCLENKREIECAYYRIGKRKIISQPGEVVTGGAFYGYKEKYSAESSVVLMPVANIPEDVSKKIRAYTDTLAQAFAVRHIARFDYFLSQDGEVYFNEVNTFPGMTEKSLYSAMLAESGLNFEGLVNALLGDEPW